MREYLIPYLHFAYCFRAVHSGYKLAWVEACRSHSKRRSKVCDCRGVRHEAPRNHEIVEVVYGLLLFVKFAVLYHAHESRPLHAHLSFVVEPVVHSLQRFKMMLVQYVRAHGKPALVSHSREALLGMWAVCLLFRKHAAVVKHIRKEAVHRNAREKLFGRFYQLAVLVLPQVTRLEHLQGVYVKRLVNFVNIIPLKKVRLLRTHLRPPLPVKYVCLRGPCVAAIYENLFHSVLNILNARSAASEPLLKHFRHDFRQPLGLAPVLPALRLGRLEYGIRYLLAVEINYLSVPFLYL